MAPGKGRGVFAAKDFREGDVIEVCPALILPKKDYKLIDESEMSNYIFAWGEDDEGYAVCFGYGSIYNHSHEPNAKFEKDLEKQHFVFKAIRDIQKGEEICTDYGWEEDSSLPDWYVPAKDEKEKKNNKGP